MSTIESLYGPVSQDIYEACKHLKLLVLDVDGVLSDGLIYLGNNNEEFKAFNTKDGYGIKAVAACGVDVAVITGRTSSIVQNRMQALNAKFIIQGEEDKQQALQTLMKECGLSPKEVASVGDDMPDAGLFALSAVKVAVQDAHPQLLQQANFVTKNKGGRGAVREFCDLILQSKGQLEYIHGASL
ncbi:3-deoxy-manno-octulosonate-8-phosphatase KdsC [Glaciecola sp. XM2]|jgi:3-deoxy-D-manno-octulosonate 8-phosphate phosphatase (KDO 8-P phosphatase)|uniref:3-deoxy-manno-octulosonate-8-phosphatase KdsC n=1 Tax=Glaciecola sp. XM2 TaxID=1914931 RepID=UPI001BDE5E09|nr:3-deoxy-manno-octulosonate-8-phosphatase KdsC [Glaciecola sp. XM2]MBT1452482.1 3-deoxy-manno-octulosonate-8-phosphatase KdsC [Glaciecola sp. XM2]